MNIRVAKTMLALCTVYLAIFYILKYFFPDVFLLQVSNPGVLKFGNLVQNHIVLLYLYYTVSTGLTYYLYNCACCGRFKFKIREIVYLAVATVSSIVVSHFVSTAGYTHIATCLMLILPLLCKGSFRNTVLAFVIHGTLSQMLFKIRGFEEVIGYVNIASGFLLSTDCYIWLVLLATIHYLKEEKHEHRTALSERHVGKETERT